MINKTIFLGLVLIYIVGSSQFALSQDVITNEKIMSSFAKIIREHQYICQPCNRVRPLGDKRTELSYEVVCNYGLSYQVVLTPESNVIVRPLNGLQIGAL